MEELKNLKISDAFTKVKLSKITNADIGKKIKTFGWIKSIRSQAKMTFFELFSGFKTIKCVAKTQKDAKSLTPWSSLTISGTVSENMTKDGYEFEIFCDSFEIISIAPSFPINAESSPYTLLELGHLALRTPERMIFLQARDCLMRKLREFFYKDECIEVTPPTLVQTQVEGGSTLFKFKYYGSDAYLTQSSQLYLETVAPVAEKVYSIVPSYRAEKSHTVRHLSEYTHVEAEFADIDFNELLDIIKRMILYVTGSFYTDMLEKIKGIDPEFEPVTFEDIPTLKYSDAIKFLNKNGQINNEKRAYRDDDDIPDHAERWICEQVGTPVFLTEFLVEHKSFYMKKCGENMKETESVDLLFPGVGEILGGSMRISNLEDLIAGFVREGIDPEPYYWYTDLAKYGSFEHGGFGLGFERLLMGLMKYKSVNKACLYPRFPDRCCP